MKTFDNHHVLVVIPARNEAETVGQLVSTILSNYEVMVLVIDDGSDDDTARVARANGARVISLLYPLGTWGALQTGFRFAVLNGFDIVVTMDADGQHPPSHMEDLVRPILRREADVSIGIYPERLSRLRRSVLILFRLIAGIDLMDITSGMRAYGPRAVFLLSREEAGLLDYQDLGVLLFLLANRCRILEIPVSMASRVSGKSRVFNSWFAILRYVVYSFILGMSKSRHWRP